MEIAEQLGVCGWVVQVLEHAAVAAARGVTVREVPTEAGPADYVLFADRQAVGVIEAKKAGTTLTRLGRDACVQAVLAALSRSRVDRELTYGHRMSYPDHSVVAVRSARRRGRLL